MVKIKTIKSLNPRDIEIGAEGGIRTHKPLKAHGPEPCMFPSFITSANLDACPVGPRSDSFGVCQFHHVRLF